MALFYCCQTGRQKSTVLFCGVLQRLAIKNAKHNIQANFKRCFGNRYHFSENQYHF